MIGTAPTIRSSRPRASPPGACHEHDCTNTGRARHGAGAEARRHLFNGGGRGSGRRQHLLQPADARLDGAGHAGRPHRARADSDPAGLRGGTVRAGAAWRPDRAKAAHRDPIPRAGGGARRRRGGSKRRDGHSRVAAGGCVLHGRTADRAARSPPLSPGQAWRDRGHGDVWPALRHPAEPHSGRLRRLPCRLAGDVLARRPAGAGGRGVDGVATAAQPSRQQARLW